MHFLNNKSQVVPYVPLQTHLTLVALSTLRSIIARGKRREKNQTNNESTLGFHPSTLCYCFLSNYCAYKLLYTSGWYTQVYVQDMNYNNYDI